MSAFLLILTSFMTAILVDFLPIKKVAQTLFLAQRESILFLKSPSPELDELQKQKKIRAYSLKILMETGKLMLFLFITFSPYLGLIYSGSSFLEKANFSSELMSLKGVFISSSVFLLYYLLKKEYGKFGL